MHGHHESVLWSHQRRTAEDSAAYLLPHLKVGLSVLDIGCGPGTITADLGARVAPGPVMAVDQSADVLDVARTEVQQRGVSNVSFATADVHRLDFDDGAFDVVHAHQMLQHVADPIAALREMRRVCAPGGVVAARDADYAGFAWFPQTPALDLWRELYQRAARANRGEPDAGRRLLSWAQQAGFADVTPTGSVVLRDARDPRMVGRNVGRPDPALAHRLRPPAPRSGRHRAARGDRRGLAGMGRLPGRLALDPTRRNPLPRLDIQSRKRSGTGCSPPPYRDRSVAPVDRRTSASMWQLPVASRLGREMISTAASAMILGLRDDSANLSPSAMFATAAVAI